MAHKKNINPVVAAGVVGAAVGAAVGVAAVELSDKKNRQAVQKKLGEFKDKGEVAYSKIKATATELSSMAADKVKGSK